MVDRTHSSLTGSDLHEPKGVATAASNTVYVANGAGGGNWTQLSAAQLNTTNNAFDANLVFVRDEQTAGTNPQTLTAATWNIRTLNTASNNTVSGASLAANQVVLPAGNYFVEGHAPGFACGYHKAKLYNLTSAADQIMGTVAFASSTAANASSSSFVRGKFVITAASTFELRHYATVTSTSVALAAGIGTEVYSELWFWKIG